MNNLPKEFDDIKEWIKTAVSNKNLSHVSYIKQCYLIVWSVKRTQKVQKKLEGLKTEKWCFYQTFSVY